MRAIQNMTEIKKTRPTYLPRRGRREGRIKNLFFFFSRAGDFI